MNWSKQKKIEYSFSIKNKKKYLFWKSKLKPLHGKVLNFTSFFRKVPFWQLFGKTTHFKSTLNKDIKTQ